MVRVSTPWRYNFTSLLRKSAECGNVYRGTGLRLKTSQLNNEKHRGVVAWPIIAVAMVYSVPATVPASGDAGPCGAIPRPILRAIFSTLCANTSIYPSQSTFHKPRSRDAAHPNRSNDAKVPSTMVRRWFFSCRYAAVLLRCCARSIQG